MKAIKVILIIGHGLIHILGFAKTFGGYTNVISSKISSFSRLFWLIASILFLVSAILYTFNKSYWYIVLLFILILSQTLIITYWNDAKWGTILNLFMLLLVATHYGNAQFERNIEKESQHILNADKSEALELLDQQKLKELPVAVRNWLIASNALDVHKTRNVRLKQIGQMKTKPNGKWIDFRAQQYFTTSPPAFLWTAKVDATPFLKLSARDLFMEGAGKMNIQLGGLIPIVDEGPNTKINSGTMLRFLAEICWFPTAAYSDYITWESVDNITAIATFNMGETSVTGKFNFTEKGEFKSFEAQRYYGSGKQSMLEDWLIEVMAYDEFDGVVIPSKAKVTWNLQEGAFTWIMLEVMELEYNTYKPYEQL